MFSDRAAANLDKSQHTTDYAELSEASRAIAPLDSDKSVIKEAPPAPATSLSGR
jgi:hypothetical protein